MLKLLLAFTTVGSSLVVQESQGGLVPAETRLVVGTKASSSYTTMSAEGNAGWASTVDYLITHTNGTAKSSCIRSLMHKAYVTPM